MATLVSLVTLATGVLTLKDSLFGGDEGARTAPGQSQQTTGEIPRFDGVAGHLSQSRALLSFLDQHDSETVYLEVGFPDILSGPLGGDNVVVDDVPEKSGTKRLVKQVSLMTKCDPPANKENPTPADGCQGTSLAIQGAENDDSGTFFQHGVPVIKGYFTVDVTGGLHMGLSPIFLRPLTFAQATGS